MMIQFYYSNLVFRKTIFDVDYLILFYYSSMQYTSFIKARLHTFLDESIFSIKTAVPS